MNKRKNYSPEEKVSILRECFLEKKTVSEICEKHEIAPNLFYRWQKQFFENGGQAFQAVEHGEKSRQAERIEFLEAKLRKKDEVLAELMEEHVQLKKNLGEI